MQTISVTSGQSLVDICMLTYANIDAMFKLMQDNEIEDANQNIEGLTLVWDEDSDLVDNQAKNNINVKDIATYEN